MYMAGMLVTPDDDTDLPARGNAIVAKGAGDIVIIDGGGNQFALPVAAGQIVPIRVIRVLATGTTATGIVALS